MLLCVVRGEVNLLWWAWLVRVGRMVEVQQDARAPGRAPGRATDGLERVLESAVWASYMKQLSEPYGAHERVI